MVNWYVYLLRCKNGTLYTGITSNLRRRFQEHKEGRGGKYTRLFQPGKLVHYESYPKKEEALKREKQIKGWRREKKENLIKYGNPNRPA